MPSFIPTIILKSCSMDSGFTLATPRYIFILREDFLDLQLQRLYNTRGTVRVCAGESLCEL